MQTKLKAGAILVALTAAGLAEAASAQTEAQAATERCRALPTDAERFACMERLVETLTASAPSAPPVAPPAVPPSASAPQAVVTPAAEPAQEAGGDDERRRFRLPFTGGRDEAVETSSVQDAGTFGAERLEARSSEPRQEETLTARVVAFEEAPYQRLRVELDNGQVWEQREADPPWRLEQYGAPGDVEIVRSRFGGYRMRLVGKSLTLSVERLR